MKINSFNENFPTPLIDNTLIVKKTYLLIGKCNVNFLNIKSKFNVLSSHFSAPYTTQPKRTGKNLGTIYFEIGFN